MQTLKPDVVMYLLERYPGHKRTTLETMWIHAWGWIEHEVRPEHLIPGFMPLVFEAIAILRVQFMLSQSDPVAHQAFNFAAYELLAPYR